VVGTGIADWLEEATEIRALLHIKLRSGLGDRRIKGLVESCGSGVRALRSLGIQTELLGPSEDRFPLSEWARIGFQLLPMTSKRYPASLLQLTDPPPVLFLKGERRLLEPEAVAIVGSRKATEGGRRAAEAIGNVLSKAGVTVVSGMALGIDGAAHRGALLGGGRTVAVLGSGLGVVYPAGHRKLFHEIGHSGLLVSEFLPTQPALRHHFPRRNRVIAALAAAVVVVEAGERSGALITVDHGLDLGREVLAVPGSVENPRARGSNALLRDGARAVPDPESILDELRELGIALNAGPEHDRSVEGNAGPVPPGLRGIWAVLSSEPRGVGDVAESARISPAEAMAGLSALELGGWARQCPGMRYRR
jgi:DNA processing protein